MTMQQRGITLSLWAQDAAGFRLITAHGNKPARALRFGRGSKPTLGTDPPWSLEVSPTAVHALLVCPPGRRAHSLSKVAP
jgi:hypothetical protein